MNGTVAWKATYTDPMEVADGLWVALRCETEYEAGQVMGHMKMEVGPRTQIYVSDEGKVVREESPRKEIDISEAVPIPSRRVHAQYFWHERGLLLPKLLRHDVDGKLALSMRFFNFEIEED
ncbi:MAG: hypothetical protein HYU36_22305 [Planctomycetes bacterium]|nr:hypothetical protein [Planctomycetota bacterium]